MEINIEHLAKLTRLELTPEEKAKFPGELEKVLNHFKELEKVDTSGVKPMTGGTALQDVFREDFSKGQNINESLVEAFPDKDKGLLRVPGIFE